jgi:hypothetical protein
MAGPAVHVAERCRAAWLWGKYNLRTGTLPSEAVLVSVVLSWDELIWAAISAALPSDRCCRILRGAGFLLFLSRNQQSSSRDLNIRRSNRCSQWSRTFEFSNRGEVGLEDVDLALTVASQFYSLSESGCSSSPSRLLDACDSLRVIIDRFPPEFAASCQGHRLSSAKLCACQPNTFVCTSDAVACVIELLQSTIDREAMRYIAAIALYSLTASVVVSIPLIPCIFSSVSSASTSTIPPGTLEGTRAMEHKNKRDRRRFGVAWTRQLRRRTADSVKPTRATLDNAACAIWVFIKVVQPQRHSGRHVYGRPHPCRLQEEVKRLYQEWVRACGRSFVPMRNAIGGCVSGLNAVRRLVYARPGSSDLRDMLPVAFGWDLVAELAAACDSLDMAASFELVRHCCRDPAAAKLLGHNCVSQRTELERESTL